MWAKGSLLSDEILYRPAEAKEVEDVADIARVSRAYFMPYLPNLHSPEEDITYFRNRVFTECEVWVVQCRRDLIGFCAFKQNWIEHVYLLLGDIGRGHGRTLVNKAKQKHSFLQLWVFQRNTRARQFYERNGFLKVKETDGALNEEKLPDVLYEWYRPRPKEFNAQI